MNFLLDLPQITNFSRVAQKYTSLYERQLTLDCPVHSGSQLIFVWYKNGVDISGDVNFVNEWIYEPTGNDAAKAGIYQCFIRNIVGSDYSITRVLEIGTFLLLLFFNATQQWFFIATNFIIANFIIGLYTLCGI